VTDIVTIGGFGLAAILAITVAILVFKLLDAVNSERASLAAETLAERARDASDFQRDQALAAQKKAETERDGALAQLAAVEKQRNEADAKETDDAAKQVADAPDGAAALAALDRELGVVPHVPDAATRPAGTAAAAGADHGHAGSDAVQPPAVAVAPDPGRHPAGG
jgi:hypothetical protein